MANLKTRFVIISIVAFAFFAPFAIIVTLEKMKSESNAFHEQELIVAAKKDAEAARYQYYLGVADRRASLKQAMDEAKVQYDQLMMDQPNLIKDNKKTVEKTVITPVVTQKVVQVPVTTTINTPSASKPKSSAKTKTS